MWPKRFTLRILWIACESLWLWDVFPRASLSYFLPLKQKSWKISCGNEMSEYSLYLVRSVSQIPKTAHSLVVDCCYALTVLSLTQLICMCGLECSQCMCHHVCFCAHIFSPYICADVSLCVRHVVSWENHRTANQKWIRVTGKGGEEGTSATSPSIINVLIVDLFSQSAPALEDKDDRMNSRSFFFLFLSAFFPYIFL